MIKARIIDSWLILHGRMHFQTAIIFLSNKLIADRIMTIKSSDRDPNLKMQVAVAERCL